ncbi:MAG: S8 family peptidase [Muribaculaceae bacterium]|nr:S8 family peptidase [Muribaculaceae bacterium]
MKKTLLSLLAIAFGCNIYAQNLDLQSLAKLRRSEFTPASTSRKLSPAKMRAEKVAPVQGAFIVLNDGCSADELRKAGVDVKSQRGNVVVGVVELARAKEIASLPCVKALNLQRDTRTNMDVARAEQNIDEIHFGKPESELTRTYTGRGVVAGIVDQGIDAHHINFRYATGESRISYLYWGRLNAAGTAVVEDHYNYETIGQFTTDTPNAYHATHTLGILGGSYTGPVSVGTPWADPLMPENTVPTELESCPFYGVAPQADLCVSCGDLQDAFVAYGLESLLNYRYYMQWPMVINMSLGSTQGPHDPRSAMGQYLDEAGKEAIICLSAGNEGDLKIALTKQLTEEDRVVKTFIYPYYYQYDPEVENSATFRNGSVEVWSNDGTPFEIKAVLYNRDRNYRAALNMPIVGENIGTYYTTSNMGSITESDIVDDPTFCRAVEQGYVGVGAKLDELTGRYYGMIDYYMLNNSKTNLNDSYVLGFEITGHPGQTISCYCDGLNTWMDNYGVEGFDDGSTDGTISDMAVAHNIVVVGSYNTRNKWTCLDGGTSRYEGEGFLPGKISGFSSYGTLADGRDLPTVCAPGAAIISSISWPYAKQMSESSINYSCSARLDEENRTNLWKQEVGTSMSTPFVAGSIALWLEANPELTVNDVKEIIAETAIVDDDVINTAERKRWGAGKFNALGGLKEAIRRYENGIRDITVDNDRLLLSPAGNNAYCIFIGTADSINASVFAADGRRVMQASAAGDELTLDLSSLPAGIYIINANGKSAKVSVK